MSNPRDVNLNSVDAMFARVLAKLEQQDEVLAEIRTEVRKTNGRVNALERIYDIGKAKIAGAVAALALVVGAIGWAVERGLHKLFGSP